MSNILYLLVEDESYRAACHAWRRRFELSTKAAYQFARSLGADGYIPGLEHELVGITMINPIPAGWTRRKVKSLVYLAPKNGEAGRQARIAIAALPAVPARDEIAQLIRHPCQISYQTSDGDQESVGIFDLGSGAVDIAWSGSDFLIQAPNIEKIITGYRDEFPDLVISGGHWSPPVGLRSISKSRWNAMESVEMEMAAD